MVRSRNPGGARRARVIALGVLVLGVAAEARAEAPAGAPALKQAREAWERGSFEAAEPLYREAIGKGGLSPSEVLEGYVRLGAVRAALGKRDPALAAFRAASILDADFVVPTQGGPRGASLARRAKSETAKLGSIRFAAEVPKEVDPGKPFYVTATLDEHHLPAVHRIGLLAKDGTTGKELTLYAEPEATVRFEVGSDLCLPGGSISVQVDALDRQKNRLATAEHRVRVVGDAPVVASAAGSEKAGASPASPAGDRGGASFWSSPWPYVLGGAAVIGAGAAVYFGTRPADTVSVGQIGVHPY